MANKIHKITLSGQEINLKHLEGIMPKTQALVLSRLMYYLQNDKFIKISEGTEYVQKSLLDWTRDLEIRFQNGKRRKLSKSSISHSFTSLIKAGFVVCKYHAKIRCFGINATKILHIIRANFAYKPRTNHVTFAPYLRDKTLDSQGLEGNFGPSTYTYTNTYTNNKSYKSDKSDERGDYFSKNIKKNFGNDRTNTQPVSIGDVIKKLPQAGMNTEQKSTIVQDMFEIWQEELPLLGEKLNREKSTWLKAAFETVFKHDLEEFRWYLKRVKTSKFIVEKPHLLNMKWLLNFETVENIQNGHYETCNPKDPSDELLDFECGLFADIGQISESERCKKTRRRILTNLGSYLYMSWFMMLSFCETDTGKLQCFDGDFVSEKANNYANSVLEKILAGQSKTNDFNG
jgi:hypothetical protein